MESGGRGISGGGDIRGWVSAKEAFVERLRTRMYNNRNLMAENGRYRAGPSINFFLV